MSAQTKYERYWERLMDKDLAEGFHSYCKKCNCNMDNESGDICGQCKKLETIEVKTDTKQIMNTNKNYNASASNDMNNTNNMKLKINIQILDDNNEEISNQSTEMCANKSGVIHSVKPLGDALIFAASLDLFQKKQVPVKDCLGNVRSIAKDVVDLSPGDVK